MSQRYRCDTWILHDDDRTHQYSATFHTHTFAKRPRLTMASELLGGSQLDERIITKAALDAAEEQLQSLCASHAGTFVSVERRARAMEQALKDLQATIQVVESKVVEAQQTLEQDEEKEASLAVLAENHRVRRRTLLQHSSLLELLELPSLMDACVRSSLYEEALSIAAFSNTLERRHKDSNVVVTRVIEQIRSRQIDLRRHLLHRLKSPVTMPQCLEVVTALRRLNSIDLERQRNSNLERVHAAMEMRLQVDFLENRDAWLDVTAALSSSKPSVVLPSASEHLLDAIERYRTRYVYVFVAYCSIFFAMLRDLFRVLSSGFLKWRLSSTQSFELMLISPNQPSHC
jgi:hypothetical protein